jgi:hypothetical protein
MLKFNKNIPSILAAVAAFATVGSQAALADHDGWRGGHDRGHYNNHWNNGFRANNFNNGYYGNGYYGNGYYNDGYANRHRSLQHEIRHELHKL